MIFAIALSTALDLGIRIHGASRAVILKALWAANQWLAISTDKKIHGTSIDLSFATSGNKYPSQSKKLTTILQGRVGSGEEEQKTGPFQFSLVVLSIGLGPSYSYRFIKRCVVVFGLVARVLNSKYILGESRVALRYQYYCYIARFVSFKSYARTIANLCVPLKQSM